ncbi:lipocalin family protein [uncultured Algoriphagus sp.]|uniref:lipocalin family protein n=1 Tax=uncultured Algoriphagus sp. TaxID=417365 RepID=UPI0030EF73D6|tara:strand:- start:1475 stop:1909 length:435 start_codon:yes stop_codon:yes gene_type:complete
MYLSIIPTLLLAFVLQTSQIKFEQLVGTWQLVHFEAMDQLRKSPQYRNANAAMREGLEYKIQNRLENTVYKFVDGDSLKYTDFVRQEIVQRDAKIEINADNVLTIHTGSETKQAKIVEFGDDKMVLEPISKNPGSGKLVFERIK